MGHSAVLSPLLLVLHPSLCNLSSHSGLGAEEPLSSVTDDTGSPLSTGYNTRSGSEEVVADAGDLQAGASLHGSQEPLANARTRMRTASELLLDRWVQEAGTGEAWDQGLSVAVAAGKAPHPGVAPRLSPPNSCGPAAGACTSPSWRRPSGLRLSRAGRCGCSEPCTSAWRRTRSCCATSSSSSTTW